MSEVHSGAGWRATWGCGNGRASECACWGAEGDAKTKSLPAYCLDRRRLEVAGGFCTGQVARHRDFLNVAVSTNSISAFAIVVAEAQVADQPPKVPDDGAFPGFGMRHRDRINR